MTGSLTADPQFATGVPPFPPVRLDPAPAKTKMSQQMRQFMPQCPINFSGPKFLQRWVQGNEAMPEIGAANSGAHAFIPLDPHAIRQNSRVEPPQKGPGAILQFLRGWQLGNYRRVEKEFELPKRRLFSRCVSHSFAAQSLKQSQPSPKFPLRLCIFRWKNEWLIGRKRAAAPSPTERAMRPHSPPCKLSRSMRKRLQGRAPLALSPNRARAG